jgi:hypothetical protein
MKKVILFFLLILMNALCFGQETPNPVKDAEFRSSLNSKSRGGFERGHISIAEVAYRMSGGLTVAPLRNSIS